METINDIFLEHNDTEETLLNEPKQVFKELSKFINKDTIFKGYCSKCSKDANLTVSYQGLNCIMKRNDVTTILDATGNVHKANCQNKVGMTLFFRIKEIIDKTVYIERASIIKEEREKYLKLFKIGSILKGRVTAIDENIGCFVNIGADYTALIPKKDLEHIFVQNITDHINIGDEVKAAIKDLTFNDKKNEFREIILNRKKVLPTYAELVAEYSQGDVIIGEVTSFNKQSPAIYTKITKHLTCICSPTPNIKLKEKQKVRIKINQIRKTVDGKIRGEILSAL